MPESSLPSVWQAPDSTQYAVLSFLARYRGDTLRAYSQDLRAFLRWCDERGLRPLEAQRPHLELYLRWMEQQGYAAATIGRRFTTVAGWYRYAVLDGHCRATQLWRSRARSCRGKGNAAPSCTRWSTPLC